VFDAEPAGIPYAKPKKPEPIVLRSDWAYKRPVSNDVGKGDLIFASVCILIGVIVRVLISFEASFYVFMLAALVIFNWIIKSIFRLQEKIKKNNKKDQ